MTSFDDFYVIHQIEGNEGLHDSLEISYCTSLNSTDPPLLAAMPYMLMLAKEDRGTDYELEVGTNDFYLPLGNNFDETDQNEAPPPRGGHRRPAEGGPPRNELLQKQLWSLKGESSQGFAYSQNSPCHRVYGVDQFFLEN